MKCRNQQSRHHMLFLYIYDIDPRIFLHNAFDSLNDSIIRGS